jgi:thiamine biosynthesis lipoprotein
MLDGGTWTWVRQGGDWPVDLADGAGSLGLRDQALASSAPLGTVFDAAGTAGHILDPRSGATARPRFRLVSVTAPSAALADMERAISA